MGKIDTTVGKIHTVSLSMSIFNLSLLNDFWLLTKPRVIALVMLTAAIGSVLAVFQHADVDWIVVFFSLLGIALVSSASAAFNCLVEIYADSIMRRTRRRPLPAGRLSPTQAAVFIAVLGGVGLALATIFGGVLLGTLTAATFFGYAVIYTLCLKTATPQNIVIGGAAGAMPPLLGWLAVSGEISYEPMLLFLIIFVWTPPHFWALALYRKEDYARAGFPMLPVTHGEKFTATQILLYAFLLFVVTLLPFASGMAGGVYLTAALALNARFLQLSWQLRKTLKPEDGRRLFSHSIFYLAALFSAFVADAIWRGIYT